MARESRRFYVDRGSQFRFDRNLISRMKAIEADSRIRGEGRANDSMIVRVEEAPLTNYPSLLRRGRTFEGEGRGRGGKIERERETYRDTRSWIRDRLTHRGPLGRLCDPSRHSTFYPTVAYD